MVDAARQMLDELMGRNRNLHPSANVKELNWDDPEFCQFHLVKFCPHDLFVNTRADLGPCPKLHDDEAKGLFENARYGARKRQFEDDFLRFCNNMLIEVDRKIQKGRQRLLLMNKSEGGLASSSGVYVSKFQEHVNNLNARIKKLLNEAEEAGHRGDVDQAQGLMTLCEQLKDEKDVLVAQHESTSIAPLSPSATSISDTVISNEVPTANQQNNTKAPSWMSDLSNPPEKQMEVCEICGAFLIVGDAQQRIEDHLMGKQHLGYSKLRKAVQEINERRLKDREGEDSRRGEDRSHRDRKDRSHDYASRSNGFRGGHYGDRRRDDDRYRSSRDHQSDRKNRDRRGRTESKHHRRSRSRSQRRSRSRSQTQSRK